ncbi:unnamed protein product [Heligmosomoides polygyrus]|uniref:Helix-turn-helix domain-containing protein n=1 Tax=Heligmosomoides polygyrus TaxID=6339 RepID=A0A183FIM7_HELPZ|nr:unnamed protein product [Heligmosomoides polygyrus]
MSNQRAAILELHRQGKRQCDIVSLLHVARSTVSKTILRFKELGYEGDRPGRGRKRTANTTRIQRIIKKRVDRNLKVCEMVGDDN